MQLHVLSAPVIQLGPNTEEIRLTVRRISLEQAKEMINMADEVVSHVGHEGTAKLLSSLLEYHIPTNRDVMLWQRGEVALALKLTIRLPEGKVLTLEELEELLEAGQIEFYLMNSP